MKWHDHQRELLSSGSWKVWNLTNTVVHKNKAVKKKAQNEIPHLFPRFVFVTKESFISLMTK